MIEVYSTIGAPQAAHKGKLEEGNTYKRILRFKAIHLMTLFIFVYVGCEIPISGTSVAFQIFSLSYGLINGVAIGWIVTYAINVRPAGKSAGYISSGFFAGTYCNLFYLVVFPLA
jgi:fucose permease